MSADDPNQRWELTVSDRDNDQLAEQLAAWLATKVDADDAPRVTSLTKPQAGGMSSTTLLFEAEWTKDGEPAGGSFVARMPPEQSAFPVFENYDLETQYAVMAGVAEATDIPVPPLCWMESDASILGSPFFVMRRVSGRVAEDNPPYVFFGWVFDSTPEERLEITRKTVEAIAKVHGIENPEQKFPMLDGEGSALRRHFEAQKQWYNWALANDGFRIPLLERTFEYLEQNWPGDSGPDVLSWGDARPGNIMFSEETGETAAVLDWEMAAIGPRELDVAWPILIHRFFQDIATQFDQPGLPDFLRRSDIEKLYQEQTGHTLVDLDWYLTYAALRHGIVMARIKRRMIHFGEDTDTADRDDYVMHRRLLEALLDGTYAWD
ncbi:phosphotransferase family protein [Nocardia sp. NBC_01503]|uniref:phosphotransferase family protein n=1 Tax=Nocardia sp. NBC_01503 TaxID=2975997 RepID=UPI002E7BA165|nr:phosphotransferase family protein [Nocardia sp. NBC_01503]WTL29675.1 phosphotransferase family protein [Nocardia sp. NBC_01503]